LFQQIRRFQLVVRRRRADQNLIAFFANVRERLDARDVDEQLRLRERSFIAGIKLCPPASTFAPSRSLASKRRLVRVSRRL
jgi:hypothetical protein